MERVWEEGRDEGGSQDTTEPEVGKGSQHREETDAKRPRKEN